MRFVGDAIVVTVGFLSCALRACCSRVALAVSFVEGCGVWWLVSMWVFVVRLLVAWCGVALRRARVV